MTRLDVGKALLAKALECDQTPELFGSEKVLSEYLQMALRCRTLGDQTQAITDWLNEGQSPKAPVGQRRGK